METPKERPKLSDPKEWALIRKIYFEPENFSEEKKEQVDRQKTKVKQTNQAR